MNKATKGKREKLRQIIEKDEPLLTAENMVEFYIGLTCRQKRVLSLLGLMTLVRSSKGSPKKVMDYLKKMEEASL
jgi:glutaredoxin 2